MIPITQEWALPGKETTVRGFSGVRLLAVDEAARVPDEHYSVRWPSLAAVWWPSRPPSAPPRLVVEACRSE